jgi:hypothetical protein
MANLNAIELPAHPLATPIPHSHTSYVTMAFITAMTAAAGAAFVLFALLALVLAAPLAPIAVAWVLLRQRKLDRTWTLRPAGT